jgi:hypothetical protein
MNTIGACCVHICPHDVIKKTHRGSIGSRRKIGCPPHPNSLLRNSIITLQMLSDQRCRFGSETERCHVLYSMNLYPKVIAACNLL